MPWKVAKRGDKFCVVGIGDAEDKGCHPTREEAIQQLRALYKNVPEARQKASWEDLMASLHLSWIEEHQFGETVVRIEPSGAEVSALVASTPAQRTLGMIGRTFDSAHPAMLFVHPHPTHVAYHGKGLKQAMGVAFFDASGVLVDRATLAPDSDPYYPRKDFSYVLEFDPSQIEVSEDSRLIL